MVLCLAIGMVFLQISPVTVWLKYDVDFFFPLENSGRKAREEKPGSFETERGERTRGEDGQTVSGTWELACEV